MPTLCIFFSLNWICSSLIHSLKHGLVKRPKWYIRFHNTFLSTVLVTFVIGARIPLKYYFKIWTQSSWIQWIKNFNEQHWTCWLLCLLYKYSRPWEIHRSYITDKGLSLFFPLPSKSNMVHASLSYHPLWPHYHTSVHDSGNEERIGLWQSTQNLWPYKWKEKQRVRAWAFRSSFIYYNVCSMQWDLHWQHHQSFILQCRKINKLIRIDEYLIARYQNACQVFVDMI